MSYCHDCKKHFLTGSEHDCRADDEKWRDHFVLPIATEMKRRGIGEMRIKLTEKGTAVFELIP